MFEDRKAEDQQFDADFRLGGEVEFEEQDGEESAELEMLMAGVRAARQSGA